MAYLAQSDGWRLERATQKRHMTTNGNTTILGRFRQIFPLTIFPDELIVEDLRVIWVRKGGPWMGEIISIMATDIASVNASSGPFFGHIHIKSLTGGPEIMVDCLPKHNVYRIRSLVEGIALTARESLEINATDFQSRLLGLLRAGAVKTDLI